MTSDVIAAVMYLPGHERRLGSDYLVCKNKYPTQWAAGPSLRGEWDSPRVASIFVLSCTYIILLMYMSKYKWVFNAWVMQHLLWALFWQYFFFYLLLLGTQGERNSQLAIYNLVQECEMT